MLIKIKKLRENAVIPKRATEQSAGCDLFACIDEPLTLPVGKIVKIPTGIAASPERNDIALLIYARSSLATKHGITLANCVGVVDSDYRGEIIIPMINLSDENYTISPGERIAQLVCTPVFFPVFEECASLDETARGEGGFGSTGKK